MFKKDASTKASAPIKSSERRKFLDNVCDLYKVPKVNLSKEIEHRLVPQPLRQAVFKSVQGYSGTIYFDDNETPVWFKSRDSDVFPSLYTCWRCPWLLPVVKTHPHVIDILSGGAQLMLPGTVPPFDSRINKDTIVAIVETDHPSVPKAVGAAGMNLAGLTRVIGTQGIAVDPLHTLDDKLFKMNKLVDIDIPKELDTSIPWKEDVANLKQTPQESDKVVENVEPESTLTTEDNSTQPESELSELLESTTIDDLVAEVATSLTPEEVDNFFVKSLFQSVQKNDIECPITSSNFMSNYIIKNLPLADPNLVNIKKTSWKKSSKFLKAMEKQKYLTTKAQGKDDLVVTWIIPKTHDKVVNFVPHKTMLTSKTSDSLKMGGLSGKKDKSIELKVVFLYKGTSGQNAFLKEVGSTSELLTANDIKIYLNKYVKIKELADKDPKKLVIDDNLRLATKLTGSHPRDKVYKDLLDRFSPYYVVLKPGEDLGEQDVQRRIKKGVPGKISVISATKIGRKVVTSVTNFEHFYIKPHVLADDLKVKCSGSATIGPCTNNPQLTEVSVQGPHGKLINEYLILKGIPVSFITVEDKTKGKKRR